MDISRVKMDENGHTDWEQILEKINLEQAVIFSQESGIKCYGPIASVSIETESIIFNLSWIAKKDECGNGWSKWRDGYKYKINTLTTTPRISDQRIHFLLSGVGHFVIMFEDDPQRLDEKLIKGLPA